MRGVGAWFHRCRAGRHRRQAVGGEEAVDAASGEELFRDDAVEEDVGVCEEFAGLIALAGVIEDARVDTFEAPGVEEGASSR